MQSHQDAESGPDSALLPAPSLGFVTVVTPLTCCFVIMWHLPLSCPFKALLLMSSSLSSSCCCHSLAWGTGSRNLLKMFLSLHFCLLAFLIFLILSWALKSAQVLCAFKWTPLCILFFSLALVRKKAPDQSEICYDSPWNPCLKHLFALWLGVLSFLSWNHRIYHFHQWCVLISLCFPCLFCCIPFYICPVSSAREGTSLCHVHRVFNSRRRMGQRCWPTKLIEAAVWSFN